MVRRHRGAYHEIYFGWANPGAVEAPNCGFVCQIAGRLMVSSFPPLEYASSLNNPIAIAAKNREIFVGHNLIGDVRSCCNDCDLWTGPYATATTVAKRVYARNIGFDRRQGF